MKKLEQTARHEGFFWAETILTDLQSMDRPVPVGWPGTIEEARDIVDRFADDLTDPVDREWVAGVVLDNARSMWRELTRPYLAEAADVRVGPRGRGRHRLLRHMRVRAA